MANLKQYAYFLKGSKIAIVENDITPENDPTSRDYGPDARAIRYKSPTSAVTDGLELEYTYSPTYWNQYTKKLGHLLATADERNRDVYTPAYGELGGYLTFYFPGTSANSGVLDMSALTTGNPIIINNHPFFNGVHKIQTASAQGYVKTYTKWPNSGLIETNEDDDLETVNFATTEIITVVGGPADAMASFNTGWAIGDYFFNTTNMGNAANEGLFTISALDTDGKSFTIDKNYYSDTTKTGALASEDAAFVGESYTSGNFSMSQVLLCEGASMTWSGVNLMEDEDFDIPLSTYESKALVYYIKAKVAEDKMDLQTKEYFMKEFKKMVEKKQSADIWGPRVIVPGKGSIR